MKNKTSTINKFIIATILILLGICLFAFAISAQPKTKEISYLVCTTGSTQRVNCKHVKTKEQVQSLVDLKFDGVSIDLGVQLKHSNYIQILTEQSGLYIEKKRIVRKKNGKIKYKKLKNN
jgi:hypothetical protein